MGSRPAKIVSVLPAAHNDDFIRVRGAQQNNLRLIDVDIPRNAFVAVTGVSGSGKSSLAFGTIYAEAQRRYFESIAPYARRLIAQLPAPRVAEIQGLPPAVALQQRRGEPTARSSVGTLTTLSNSLRMLFSRAGKYPEGITERLDSDAFSPNTPAGACPECHGIGIIHSVSEQSLVPDPSLTIRQGAIAAWPGAWQGKNFRDILDALGYDVDKPWNQLSQKDRDWILFTDERPIVTVYAVREAHRIQRPYQGTYLSAAAYVRHTFATTNSATLRKRVLRFMTSATCHECQGKRLKKTSLAVKFAGHDVAELGQLPLTELSKLLKSASLKTSEAGSLIIKDLLERIKLINEIGLGYLSMDRTVPTLSAGELQRLRLATQLRSGLFGVVYVLDEPSAGLHPADSEALFEMLQQLKNNGNSLLVVEHEMDLIRQADWIVDIGPGAGDGGGSLLYSGPVAGLEDVKESVTRRYLFHHYPQGNRTARRDGWNLIDGLKADNRLRLSGINRHNLKDLTVDFPLGALTVVTGVSGSGKSTLVSHVLAETLADRFGAEKEMEEEEFDDEEEDLESLTTPSASIEGIATLTRLVSVDQKPIGRTPRSNLATYTGLFDHIRKRFATTPEAKARGYSAGRFSFNVAGGRCTTCEGEGFISIELLFLPRVYAPCSSCGGSRYNAETMAVTYRGLNIAQVLDMTVDAASEFFTEIPPVARALKTLRDVGLGYLRLGQPATELSGGEAQRIKLATELQREQHGNTVYLLDEPTTGLHPDDTKKLLILLHALVEAGNTVIVVEHDMDVVASADWVIDLGPGAANEGGLVVAAGPPSAIVNEPGSRTAPYLAKKLGMECRS
ncbi:MAG TPA: excinuclease ABC subunit UvrA [Candidatus Obscuribacterales bacterium]